MARPLRIEFEGAWYHVMNRGAGRRSIFGRDDDRRRFLDLIDDAARLFDVEAHAYCLMSNHYHLLVRTPQANLSRVMHHVDGVYAQYFNRTRGTDGPLFRGRYTAILVEADSHLLCVSRYVHQNPVAAGMVKRPEEFEWSSYRSFVGLAEAPAWLHVEETLGMLSGSERRRDYRRFVRAGVDELTESFYASERSPPVLGSRSFRERIDRDCARRPDVPDSSRIRARPGIDEVLDEVARYYAIPRERLVEVGHGGRPNRARGVAMLFCREIAGAKLSKIAERFGINRGTSVSKSNSCLRRAIETDTELANDVAAMRTRLDRRAPR